MPEMTELECRPRGAAAKDWLADAPSAGLASLGSLHFTAAIHHSRLCACDFYANPSTHPTPGVRRPPECSPSHLRGAGGGGRGTVLGGAAASSSSSKDGVKDSANRAQVRERRSTKTKDKISKSRFVGQSERVTVSRTGSRK